VRSPQDKSRRRVPAKAPLRSSSMVCMLFIMSAAVCVSMRSGYAGLASVGIFYKWQALIARENA
jgi:fatty acid desaturase